MMGKDVGDEAYRAISDREASDLLTLMKSCDHAVTNADLFVDDLSRQLNILDGDNIYSIMASEESINHLMNLLEIGIKNAESLESRCSKCLFSSTDYGRPMKHFFIEIPISLGLGRQFGHIDFEAFGVFSFHLLAPILVPLSMFSINQLLFLQKNLYIQIPNIHLGFGCDFGPQRIRNLAIVCP